MSRSSQSSQSSQRSLIQQVMSLNQRDAPTADSAASLNRILVEKPRIENLTQSHDVPKFKDSRHFRRCAAKVRFSCGEQLYRQRWWVILWS